MRSKHSYQNQRKAFTLVELLVVISIIALLLALLLPALNKARAQARRTVCASQLSSSGTAFITYATDYTFFPWPGTVANTPEGISACSLYKIPPGQAFALAKYGISDTIDDSWRCPSYRSSMGDPFSKAGYRKNISGDNVECPREEADYFYIDCYRIQTHLNTAARKTSTTQIKYLFYGNRMGPFKPGRSPGKLTDRSGPLLADRLQRWGHFTSNHCKLSGGLSPIGYNQLYSDGSVIWWPISKVVPGLVIGDVPNFSAATCAPADLTSNNPYYYWVE
ncbi:MAG: prepilin-type N-terminal cleavage/methylation domain-containing protein [Phycisphaerae bacterium]